MDANSPAVHSLPSDSAAANLPPRWQRIGLNLLAALILTTIGWCNLPDSVPVAAREQVKNTCSPELAYRIQLSEWLWRWGAHLAGLDNKWQMYGLQSRFNWRYEIIATYGQGEQAVERLLPLPRQTERSTWQRWVVDFKEAKFHLNIYNNPVAHETYARYLARQFPEYGGQRLERIRFDLKYQYILPPMVAVKEQQLLENFVQTDTVSDFALANEAAEAIGLSPQLTPAGKLTRNVTSSR
ncbi:MAG: hypothetical protein ACKO81_18075 [Planctomycetota bacterium]